jgi:hypothetical protein
VGTLDCLTNYKVKSNKYYVHHVTLSDLDSSNHKFIITNGLVPWLDFSTSGYEYAFDIQSELAFSTSEFVQPEVLVPDPMYGKIYGMVQDDEGFISEDRSKDSIIFVGVVDENDNLISNLLSAPTNGEGGWSIDKGSFRDLEGNNFEELDGMNGRVCYQYEDYAPKQCYEVTFGENDAPVEGISGTSESDFSFEEAEEEVLSKLVSSVYAAYDQSKCIDGAKVAGKTYTFGEVEIPNCDPTKPCVKACKWDGVQVYYVNAGICARPWTCGNSERQTVEINGEEKVIDKSQSVNTETGDVYLQEGEKIYEYTDDGQKIEAKVNDLLNIRWDGNPAVNTYIENYLSSIKPCEEYSFNECPEDRCNAISESDRCIRIIDETPLENEGPDAETNAEISEYLGNSPVVNVSYLLNYSRPSSCEAVGGYWVGSFLSGASDVITVNKCYWTEETGIGKNCDENNYSYCPMASWCKWDGAKNICVDKSSTITYSFNTIKIFNEDDTDEIVCCGVNSEYGPTSKNDCNRKGGSFGDFMEHDACSRYVVENSNQLCVDSSDNLCTCGESGCQENVHSLLYRLQYENPDLEVVVENDQGEVNWNPEYIMEQMSGDITYYCKNNSGAYKQQQSLYTPITDCLIVSIQEVAESKIKCLNTETQKVEWRDNCSGAKYEKLEDLYSNLGILLNWNSNTDTYDFNTGYVKDGNVCCFNSNTGVDPELKTISEGCGNFSEIIEFTNGKCEKPEVEGAQDEQSLLDNMGNILQKLRSFSISTPVSAQTNDEVFLSITKEGYYEVVTSNNEKTIQYYDPDNKYIYFNDTNADGSFDVADGDYLISSSVAGLNITQVSNSYDLELKKGLNLISFDFYPALDVGESYTAQQFMEESNTNDEVISQITYFSNGSWNGGVMSKSTEAATTAGTDFPLLPGFGYAIVATRDSTVQMPGFDINTNVPVAFISGWNLIGVNGYNTAFTARTLINSVNSITGLTADNVTWWPTSKGMYEGLQVSEGTEYGFDYPISSSNGYFVRISDFEPEDSTCKSLIWHPDGELNGQCGNN